MDALERLRINLERRVWGARPGFYRFFYRTVRHDGARRSTSQHRRPA